MAHGHGMAHPVGPMAHMPPHAKAAFPLGMLGGGTNMGPAAGSPPTPAPMAAAQPAAPMPAAAAGPGMGPPPGG